MSRYAAICSAAPPGALSSANRLFRKSAHARPSVGPIPTPPVWLTASLETKSLFRTVTWCSEYTTAPPKSSLWLPTNTLPPTYDRVPVSRLPRSSAPPSLDAVLSQNIEVVSWRDDAEQMAPPSPALLP